MTGNCQQQADPFPLGSTALFHPSSGTGHFFAFFLPLFLHCSLYRVSWRFICAAKLCGDRGSHGDPGYVMLFEIDVIDFRLV